MERVCPDFTKWNEVIQESSKWQDKVETMQQLCAFIEKNPDSFSQIQEAAIEYAALISNNFKASNINLLKGSYSIARCVIQHCGAGPRACSKVIDFCVLKIHDKKIGPELSSLLLDIAEKIGPNAVIDAVILRERIHCRFAVA